MTRLAIIACVLLAGCATAPAVTISCPAAENMPYEPARTIKTDARKPGEVVRAAQINRAQWIAHADELTARLRKCKQ